MRLHQLSSDDLLSSLRAALSDERRLVANVIAYLVEVETRRLHLDLACSSMFEFCTKKLGLTESEAFRRLTAARLVQRFPKLLDAVASGQLHLSSVVLLRDLFTESNLDELIAAATGKTKRQVAELVARLAPKPDVPTSFRKLPERPDRPLSLPLVGPPASLPRSTSDGPSVTPLSEDRYKLQLTASKTFREKLERACELMSHRIPNGDLAVMLERALEVLIEKLEKEKLGKLARPRAARAASIPSRASERAASNDPGRITRAVRREVASRDGEQCTYRSPTGERCSARSLLEFDHRQPRALGGVGDTSNVRLLCRSHNRHAAEQVFGRAFIDEKIYFSRSKCPIDEPREIVSSSNPAAVPREIVREALLRMGFRSSVTDRTLAALTPERWLRPVEEVLRDAIGMLTP